MVLEILKFPDKRLRQKCRPLSEDEIKNTAVLPETDKTVLDFVHDLVETMFTANGLGLAAPQVGVPIRVFVMRSVDVNGIPSAIVVVNPVLSEQSGEQKIEEGCLSIPDTRVRTERFMKVVLNSSSLSKALKLKGLLAACAQHEINHLDGILITDNPRHRIM